MARIADLKSAADKSREGPFSSGAFYSGATYSTKGLFHAGALPPCGLLWGAEGLFLIAWLRMRLARLLAFVCRLRQADGL